ncbi:hypothetical protein VPJ68_00640, partial [Parabacteroides distasonis]
TVGAVSSGPLYRVSCEWFSYISASGGFPDSAMTSGTFPPPVPIRPVSICTLSSSEIFTRLSAGWFSNATAAGTTPARSVGEVSSSYPMPPDCAECSVQNPAA